MYTVKFNHPDFEKDEVFDLTGIGEIKNGGSVKLDADAERDFVARIGESVKDYFKDSEMVEVSGSSELKTDEVKDLKPEPEGGET